MVAAMVADPQERAIQTVRPALRMATAIRGTTAEDREGVRPGLRVMTALNVMTVQGVTTGRAVMTVQAGMTAGVVTTVRTGKAARIGRVSQTVQTVQIGLKARTGLIGPTAKTVKTATTVMTDRADRTERAVEALLTTVLATGVLASPLARDAINARHAGHQCRGLRLLRTGSFISELQGGLCPPFQCMTHHSCSPLQNFQFRMFMAPCDTSGHFPPPSAGLPAQFLFKKTCPAYPRHWLKNRRGGGGF